MTNWDAAVSFTTSLPQWPRTQTRAFLLENVKGLVTQHSATFYHVLKELRLIGTGAYKVGHRIMDAAYYGLAPLLPCANCPLQVAGTMQAPTVAQRAPMANGRR